MFVASCGKYSCFCSVDPNFLKIVLIRVLCTSHITLTEGSTLASSSITKLATKKVELVPPYWDSISIPKSCWLQKIEIIIQYDSNSQCASGFKHKNNQSNKY